MALFVYAEQSGAVDTLSVWFVFALIAILVPSAPALFQLDPLWRNYFVPFTGPARNDISVVAKRFLYWGLGGIAAAIPIALVLILFFGNPESRLQ